MASGGGLRSVLGSSDEVLDLKCGICIKKESIERRRRFVKNVRDIFAVLVQKHIFGSRP